MQTCIRSAIQKIILIVQIGSVKTSSLPLHCHFVVVDVVVVILMLGITYQQLSSSSLSIPCDTQVKYWEINGWNITHFRAL